MKRYGIIFAAGAVLPVVYAVVGQEYPIPDGGEMVAIAENLVREGTFGNPFVPFMTGVTAAVPPLYPFYLAGLFEFFGPGYGRLVLVLLTAAMYGIHACLLVRLARLFYGEEAPGIYAAALSVLLPAIRFMSGWDAVYTASGMMLFCLFSDWALADVNRAPWKGLLPGVFAGVLMHLNPLSVLVCASWILYLLMAKHLSRRKAFEVSGSFAVALLLTCLPWMLRNYYQLGAPALRTNFGLTIYASNNECAEPSLIMQLRSGCQQSHYPSTSASEAQLLRKLGEPGYNTDRMRAAIRWIRGNPGRFIHLTAARSIGFWFPEPSGGRYSYSLWLITPLFLAGLIMMLRHRVPVAWFVLIACSVYPLINYIVVSELRYRYPILWLSLLPGGYFIKEALRWHRAGNISVEIPKNAAPFR